MSVQPVSPGDIFMWVKTDTLHIVTERMKHWDGWRLVSLTDPVGWCWDEEKNLLRRNGNWRRMA